MKRETLVDKVKVIACIMAVLGHLYQSMIKADILENSSFYIWFNSTIYMFLVPLFSVAGILSEIFYS